MTHETPELTYGRDKQLETTYYQFLLMDVGQYFLAGVMTWWVGHILTDTLLATYGQHDGLPPQAWLLVAVLAFSPIVYPLMVRTVLGWDRKALGLALNGWRLARMAVRDLTLLVLFIAMFTGWALKDMDPQGFSMLQLLLVTVALSCFVLGLSQSGSLLLDREITDELGPD